MNSIYIARENCAVVVFQYYPDARLSADMLGERGEYRSFWETVDNRVLECLSDNIFNPRKSISIYELRYVDKSSSGMLLS